jgi:hypothetical protein
MVASPRINPKLTWFKRANHLQVIEIIGEYLRALSAKHP